MKGKSVILAVAGAVFLSVTLSCSTLNKAPAHKRQTNSAQRKKISFKELKKNFAEPDMIYAPFAFWFWDTALDPNHTAAMAKEMCRQRMNPGYAHPRRGLPNEQWLSPLWFKSFDAALKEAVSAGAYLGYCDEYWWPSGRADGRVLRAHPELKAVSLKCEIIDVNEAQSIKIDDCFFAVAARHANVQTKKNNNYALIKSSTLKIIGSGKAFQWTSPKGKWRIYRFSKYHRPGLDHGDVNYIDRRLPKAFIEIAHKCYAEHFGKHMGKSIPGVFVDNEGDYGYQIAWSDDLDKEYKQKKGRDIRLWMPLLLDDDEEGLWAKARWDWYDVASFIYTDSFLGEVSRWLDAHNMYDISNLWEETLVLQTFAVGDFFSAQRAVTMPGTDCLVQKALQVHDFKETQSVTEFESKRFQSEILGVAGWHMTPVLMKKAANAVIAWGVSHIVPHGVNLNRELVKIPYPPDWFTSNPYWRYFHLWTDFARRASYINSHGHTVPDVLLVNPIDSTWALLGGKIMNSEIKFMDMYVGKSIDDALRPDTIREIDRIYAKAIADLTAARIEYLVADRHYIRQMKVTNKGRLVRGQFEFKAVVLPPMIILPLDVAEKIVAFAKAGGYVYTIGDLPAGSTDNGFDDPKMKKLMNTLKAQPTVESAPNGIPQLVGDKVPFMESQVGFKTGTFPLIQLHRRIDGRDFFWLVNNTDTEHQCTVSIRDVKGLAAIWDCEKGTRTKIISQQTPQNSTTKLTFKPYEAYWLVFDPDREPYKPKKPPENPLENIIALDGTWNIHIDVSVQPPPAAPNLGATEILLSQSGDRKKLTSWLDWQLDKFSGFVDYTKTFTLNNNIDKAIIDLGTVKHTAEVWVNGKPLGCRLWPPFEFNITKALRKGQNTVKIRIGNLIANAFKQYEKPNWGWTKPKDKEDFESGLFGPVVIKYKN